MKKEYPICEELTCKNCGCVFRVYVKRETKDIDLCMHCNDNFAGYFTG